MKSVLRIVVSMILTALAVAMGWLLLRPPNPRRSSGVTVNVIGITNDAAGARQATFRVSNTGRHRVTIAPSFVLENHSGQWHTNLLPVGHATRATYYAVSIAILIQLLEQVKFQAVRRIDGEFFQPVIVGHKQ
jgi:hypothetical protein